MLVMPTSTSIYHIIHVFSWRYLYLQLLQAKSRQNLSLLAVPWINFYSSNRAAAVSAAMPRMVTLVVTIAKSWNVSSWHFSIDSTKYWMTQMATLVVISAKIFLPFCDISSNISSWLGIRRSDTGKYLKIIPKLLSFENLRICNHVLLFNKI